MNKEIDLADKITNYTYDDIEKRGIAIFYEWRDKGVKSRKIVGCVERSIYEMNPKGATQSHFEALSFLYALDMRVKEKYKNIIHCILSYFSWRRETRALNLLRASLRIPAKGDIRLMIERGLEGIRNELGEEESNEKVGGGKANRPSNEKDVSSEKGKYESSPENEKEKTADAVEDSRENDNEKIDKSELKDAIEAYPNEKKDSAKRLDEPKKFENKLEALKPEKKEKSRGVETEFKQREDNEPKENNPYNEEIDYAPLPEHVYGDGMFFGMDDLVRGILVDDTESRNAELFGNELQFDEKKEKNTIDYQDGAIGNTDIDERIKGIAESGKIDKISTVSKNEYSDKAHSDKEIGDNRIAEGKNADNANKESREAIQVEQSEDAENEMRRQINDNLTVEQIVAIKQGMEEKMREQICIEEEIFNAEDSAKQNVKRESVQIKGEAKQSNMADRR